ncbi:MAG: hypothetical protein QXR19_17660, partial [Candidatus Jordarchaeaceae archaeon]
FNHLSTKTSWGCCPDVFVVHILFNGRRPQIKLSKVSEVLENRYINSEDLDNTLMAGTEEFYAVFF